MQVISEGLKTEFIKQILKHLVNRAISPNWK